MIKKMLCFVLVFGLLLCLSACLMVPNNVSEPTEKATQQATTKMQATTQPTTVEKVTETPKLSQAFDKILATGRDGDDYYEVVANETEDYIGTKVEIGIIKNNEWLVEPTTSMPFIDSDGTIYGTKSTTIFADGDNDKMIYIGNGCFLWQSGGSKTVYDWECVVYNVENGLYYNFIQDDSDYICRSYDNVVGFYDCYRNYSKLSDTNNQVIVNVIKYSKSMEVEILNTSTMAVRTVIAPTIKSALSFYPISEGIFAISTHDNVITFYDDNGNVLIENEFKLSDWKQRIVFKNGKCTFKIVNDAGNVYKITIDKQGNVIDSVKISG